MGRRRFLMRACCSVSGTYCITSTTRSPRPNSGTPNMTDWQKRNMRSAITSLVYSSLETAYDPQIEFMRTILAAPEKIAKWFDYFESNWNACRGKWCSYLRCSVTHLGNNTNNRLESSWQKLKALVNKFKPFDEKFASDRGGERLARLGDITLRTPTHKSTRSPVLSVPTL
ncbi:TPA: hypothetical protein N0F65_009547 [Lagenidium giganteum]|uniref:Uncharacterized protein n=1 Tax=Lagenidium giganteum TaxID=4803 RepID=A0AAV2YU38_9STRA|nr:TPA: hypothetical protein N0F65_009547 [Lagenidium giganteum]